MLISEWEYISADWVEDDERVATQPRRMIYAETVELDEALVREG